MFGRFYSSHLRLERVHGRRDVHDPSMNHVSHHERHRVIHEVVQDPIDDLDIPRLQARQRPSNRHLRNAEVQHEIQTSIAEVQLENQTSIKISLAKIGYEVSLYSRQVQKRLEPVIKNERVMKVAAETLSRFDSEPELLVAISAELLKHAGSVMQEADDGTEPWVGEESADEDGSDDTRAELGRLDLGPRQTGWRPNSGANSTRFLRWSGFKPYDLCGKPDIVDNRKRVLASLWHAVKLGITTSLGGFEVEGLFGALLGTIRRQDWGAYLKTMDRKILLPDVTSMNPDQQKLEEFEKNLLGTTKLIGVSRDLTCITYSNSDFGTITHFQVEMTQKNGEEWPTSIHPLAVMESVPKKILKITADGVPRSQKTTLRVSTGKTKPLKWSLPSKQSRPFLEHSDNIQRSHMSTNMQRALGIDLTKAKSKPSVNFVMATIPQMLAWLHVKASYLTNIEIDGIDFQPRRDGKTKRQSFRRVVRWRNAPATMEHEGTNPHIVLLHPESGAWVTKPLYWT